MNRRPGRTLFSLAWLMLLAISAHSRADEPSPLEPPLRDKCLQVLRAGLASDEFWPAMHAAEALTLAGRGEEVIRSLRASLPRERDDQHRCGLARELVRAGDRSPLNILFTILDDQQSNGRTHAAESLFKINQPGDRRGLQAAFDQSADTQLQLMAAAALARAGDKAALHHLREQLQADETRSRVIAAFALAVVGTPDDVPQLLAARDREADAEARAMIVGALAILGHAEGRAELGRNLHSPKVTIRTMSAEYVGRSRSHQLRPKLIELLDDPALDVRVRAAQSLFALSQGAAPR